MIPLSTTTITVTRVPPDPARDGYDTQPAAAPVASNVRAVIGSYSGRQQITTGDRTVVTFTLRADPCDIRADDTVTDNGNGQTYRVIWARVRIALGLDHVEANLEQVAGAS